MIGATFWPVALFVAIEILTRVAWPSGRGWQLLRFGGITPVALVAAVVSYRHLSGLLAYYGEDPVTCVFGPLAVDGLMVISSAALLATADHARTLDSLTVPAVPPVPAPAPTLPAVPAPSTTAPQSAGNPAPTEDPAQSPEPVPATRIDAVPTPADVAPRITPDPAKIPLRPTATRPVAARTSKPKPRTPQPTASAEPLAAPATDTPVTEPEPAQMSLPMPVDPGLLAKARQVAEQHHADTGTPIKAGQLAARLRVNSELATQALAVLNLGSDNPTTNTTTVNGTPVKATR
ncbi:hypothetical protein [Paractinoplanes lichenicola]|uniref:DUF2637 domain-containing protein n=1 Tax=Paractinoplanes lichenicola TaxID=2802976 RepID=A0ABS1VXI8_9ACTN|nr:hypothetical protein [Actinoplanes lichenicola]MBL7259167.1 hypothetical protein [Actinoplanes lichenicola]